MTEFNYIALTGDIVASRASSDDVRTKVQTELTSLLRRLNERLGSSRTVAPLVQTAGDELQGLFRAPDTAIDVLREISDHMYGAHLGFEGGGGQLLKKVAFGVGNGALSTTADTPYEERNVGRLDGPCFHNARDALETSKKERLWVTFRGFGPVADQVLGSLFELMGAIRSGWTPLQSLHTVLMRQREWQKQVAQELRVNPSVISESLKAANYEAIVRGEEAAKQLANLIVSYPIANDARSDA
jgi:hypothetical protein